MIAIEYTCYLTYPIFQSFPKTYVYVQNLKNRTITFDSKQKIVMLGEVLKFGECHLFYYYLNKVDFFPFFGRNQQRKTVCLQRTKCFLLNTIA